MDHKSIIIGLTGSFGSGCTSLSAVLERKFNFKRLSLSEAVKTEAKRRGLSLTRENLQDVGDSLRQEHGLGHLAELARKKAGRGLRFAFDGIRNPAEIDVFRNYRNFYLVAMQASKEARWHRLLKKEVYTLTKRDDFDRDDRRDQDERFIHGQNVVACVNTADILFANEDYYETPAILKANLQSRFARYVDLITKQEDKSPTTDETMMSIASSLALQSSCIKRGVGAVLCNKDNQIVFAACNEVPVGNPTCFQRYRGCYRDLLRDQQQKTFVKSHLYCPQCGGKYEILKDMERICVNCNTPLTKFFEKAKMLDKCRAIHAEEAVLLGAEAADTGGGVLYTTTSPCMQCAKRAASARLSQVVYIDPYPEEEGLKILKDAGVEMVQFEGIKGQAFHRVYNWQQAIREAEADRLREEEEEER
jgi:deoxycytidylate deaminase